MYVFTSMACSSSERGMVLDEFLDFYEFYFWIRCVSAWLSSSGRWKGEAGGLYIPSELPSIAHFPFLLLLRSCSYLLRCCGLHIPSELPTSAHFLLLLLLRSCSYLLRWCGLHIPSELPTSAQFPLLLLLRSCSYLLRWWAPAPQASVSQRALPA